jgi:hypothetical protein
MLEIGREIVMAIQKKSLNSSLKGSKKAKSAAGRAAKTKGSVRAAKHVSMKKGLPVYELPAVQ